MWRKTAWTSALRRAAIWRSTASGNKRLYATGPRNPVGIAWAPDGKTPDGGQRTRRAGQRPGARLHDISERRRLLRLALQLFFLGSTWTPASRRNAPDPVARAIVPDYVLSAHGVPGAGLGRARLRLPAPFTGGMFVGQHDHGTAIRAGLQGHLRAVRQCAERPGTRC